MIYLVFVRVKKGSSSSIERAGCPSECTLYREALPQQNTRVESVTGRADSSENTVGSVMIERLVSQKS